MPLLDKNTEKNPKESPPRANRFPALGIYLLVFMLLIYGLNYFFGENLVAKEITFQEFVNEFLPGKDVERLEVINEQQAFVYIKPASLAKDKFKDAHKKKPGIPQYFFTIGSVETFEKKLDEAQSSVPSGEKIPVRYVKRTNWLVESLPWLAPLVLLFFFWRFIFSRAPMNPGNMGGGIFSFGKSSAIPTKSPKGAPTFKDVAGYEEAKAEIMEIVDFLRNPESFTKLGAKIPKGVLLIGPPGTGKTLMAKAVAGEAGVPFFSLAGSEFVEMFVGVGASRVRDLFKNAKAAAPCIIFIDELDTVGRARENAASMHVNDERESTLNQLLAEMDGFGSDTRIIVLAATNRADVLDPALVRAGRFDRHIYLELPDKKERTDIFTVHMKKLKFNPSLDPGFLASQTPGFSGADIANACNEAALIAARQKKESIELNHFIDAIEKVIGGLEKRSAVINPKEKKIIAYHESGHALVSWMLPHTDPLIKVSIIPRGKSLGSAWYLPEERKIITKSEFEDRMCTALGGRAAEELIFGDVSSGAIDDLEKVTKMAYSMVQNLGFNAKIGNVSYYDSSGRRESGLFKPYSEATAALIDSEVHSLIQSVYNKAKHILETNRDKLAKMAELLNEKENLNKEQIESILGVRPAAP